jgi:hypothetical protein
VDFYTNDFWRQNNTFRQYVTAGLCELGLNICELVRMAEHAAVFSLGNMHSTVSSWREHGEFIVIPGLPITERLADRTAKASMHAMAVQVDGKVEGHVGPKCWVRKCGAQSPFKDTLKGAEDLHTIEDYLNALGLAPTKLEGVVEFYVSERPTCNTEVRVFVDQKAVQQFVAPVVKAFSPGLCAEQIAFAAMCKIQRGLRRKKKAS